MAGRFAAVVPQGSAQWTDQLELLASGGLGVGRGDGDVVFKGFAFLGICFAMWHICFRSVFLCLFISIYVYADSWTETLRIVLAVGC